MALEASELEALRDALILARAKGLRAVEYDGRRTEYRSDPEMAAAISDLDARIARASGSRPRTVAFAASKGV